MAAILFSLLFAVASGDSSHHEGHCDASSVVQLKADKTLPAYCDGWKLGNLGASCTQTCGDECTSESLVKQNSISGNALKDVINNCFDVYPPNPDPLPFGAVMDPGVVYSSPGSPSYIASSSFSTCEATGGVLHRRLCFCDTPPVAEAPVTGDPHIKTLRGDHYTLLKSGTFLAWSYQDGTSGKNQWRLLASYSGARFTTAGLLLEGPVVMELTAQNCQWRQKEAGQWHNVMLGDHGGHVDVLDLNRTVKGHLPLGSTMLLKAQKEHTKVAKLVTHCRRGLRVDYMVSIYNPDELQHMGGELAAPKHRTENQVHFLSSQHVVNTQTDSEFEVPTPWLTLGGSEEAEAYLKARMAATSTSFMRTTMDCSDAEQICSKHMPTDSEAFGDCVFDVCNGDEADAEAAAEMLAETQ